jgi:hypothetical protein
MVRWIAVLKHGVLGHLDQFILAQDGGNNPRPPGGTMRMYRPTDRIIQNALLADRNLI